MGRENLPRGGGWILASNHISHFDPPVYCIALRRRLDFMAMDDLFRHPVARVAFDLMAAFPVDRHARDAKALRTALRRLEHGCAVAIFPEGGLRTGPSSVLEGADMKPGASMLAALAGAPVVPAVVLGSDRLYDRKLWWPARKRVSVWVGVGETLRLDPSLKKSAAVEDMQTRLKAALIDLKDKMVEHFQLQPEDMPQTPQRRKGDDPGA